MADDGGTTGYDVLADTSAFASGLVFPGASAYVAVTAASHQMEVRNTGTTADLINQSISVTGGSSYTYVIGGPGAAPNAFLLTDTTTAATSGNVQIRIANATGVFGAMDVYITAPGTDLFSVSANVPGLGFGSGSTYQTLATGTYEVRITKPSDPNKIVYYDSGGIALASGAVVTFVIQGPGSNPGGLPLSLQQLTDASGT